MRQDVDSLDGTSLERWLKEPAADAQPATCVITQHRERAGDFGFLMRTVTAYVENPI